MQDLASLGLTVRASRSNDSNEQRLELRLTSTDAFVAWFQRKARTSAGERIVSTNTQMVRRDDLSIQQVAAVTEWLREQALSAV